MDVNPGLYLRSSEATGMEFILDKKKLKRKPTKQSLGQSTTKEKLLMKSEQGKHDL